MPDSISTPLLRAVRRGDSDDVERLLALGADASDCDHNGYGLVVLAVLARPVESELDRIVRLLVARGADVNFLSKHGESALREASRQASIPIVQTLLELGGDRSHLGWTPLHEAVAFGDDADVARELAKAPRIDTLDSWNRTAWHLAIRLGHMGKARQLRSAGCMPNTPGHCGTTPLMYSIEGDHLPMLEWLLEEGADPLTTDDFDSGIDTVALSSSAVACLPLLLERGLLNADGIADAHDHTIINILLDAGGDIDSFNDEGDTLLMSAADDGDLTRTQLLLARGADPDATQTGETALHRALRSDAIDIAKLLIDAGADPDQPDVDGECPLAFARSRPAIDMLLAAGADPSQGDATGDGQIDILARRGHEELAMHAHRRAAQNQPDFAGSRLHAAACRRQFAMMLDCLSTGASAEAVDRQGRTPLHWLASRKRSWDSAGRILFAHAEDTNRSTKLEVEATPDECIDLLLKNGAHLDARDSDETTPLLEALQWEQHDTARNLIRRGATATARDSTGWTPVLLVACGDDIDMLEFLLQHGGSLNDEREGWSPLHYAVHHGHDAMVRHLLSLGLDPNGKNRSGIPLSTPAHSAAFMGHAGILRTLLLAGASPCPIDGHGKTPRDYAIANKQQTEEWATLSLDPEGSTTEETHAEITDKIIRLLDETTNR